jgi:hypothetical protein
MTSTDWLAVLAGAPAFIAAIVGVINAFRIQKVHVLVNSKMSDALALIATLRGERDAANAAKDVANAATDVANATIAAVVPRRIPE